nr:unnamed protein product [Callosobruchus analis]
MAEKAVSMKSYINITHVLTTFFRHKLFYLLKGKGSSASGTIRENRTRNNSLEAVKSIKKKKEDLMTFPSMRRMSPATDNCKTQVLVAARKYDRKEKRILVFLSLQYLQNIIGVWEELIYMITESQTTGNT